MHEASFEKMRAFRAAYITLDSERPLRVLDVGSGCGEGSLSYRELFSPPDFSYTGLDVAQGHNVDLVPEDTFQWSELDNESFDIVISGQMLEHNPYFWISCAEIARVLVQGGLTAVIAPSSGHPHRYPFDCWRFYPDSWSSICQYTGLDLMETYRERIAWNMVVPGTYWRDAMMIARKPFFADMIAQSSFYDRIDTIVSTRVAAPQPAKGRKVLGPAGQRYEAAQTVPSSRAALRPPRVAVLASKEYQKLKSQRLVEALRRRFSARDARLSTARGEALAPWPDVTPESQIR
jgi:SAM-dependent methyltransferase